MSSCCGLQIKGFLDGLFGQVLHKLSNFLGAYQHVSSSRNEGCSKSEIVSELFIISSWATVPKQLCSWSVALQKVGCCSASISEKWNKHKQVPFTGEKKRRNASFLKCFFLCLYFVNSVTLAFGSHQGACLHMAKTTRFFIYLAGTSITAVRDDFILYWINCWKKFLMGAKITYVICIIIMGFVTWELQRTSYCPKALLEVGLRVEISVYFCIELVLFSALLFYIPFLWRTAIIMADEKAAEISLAAGSL